MFLSQRFLCLGKKAKPHLYEMHLVSQTSETN
jgi:hypothetical protein